MVGRDVWSWGAKRQAPARKIFCQIDAHTLPQFLEKFRWFSLEISISRTLPTFELVRTRSCGTEHSESDVRCSYLSFGGVCLHFVHRSDFAARVSIFGNFEKSTTHWGFRSHPRFWLETITSQSWGLSVLLDWPRLGPWLVAFVFSDHKFRSCARIPEQKINPGSFSC